jgi:hypothetical protein
VKCVDPGGQSAGTKQTLLAQCGGSAKHRTTRRGCAGWSRRFRGYDALSGVLRRVLVLVNLLPHAKLRSEVAALGDTWAAAGVVGPGVGAWWRCSLYLRRLFWRNQRIEEKDGELFVP